MVAAEALEYFDHLDAVDTLNFFYNSDDSGSDISVPSRSVSASDEDSFDSEDRTRAEVDASTTIHGRGE